MHRVSIISLLLQQNLMKSRLRSQLHHLSEWAKGSSHKREDRAEEKAQWFRINNCSSRSQLHHLSEWAKGSSLTRAGEKAQWLKA